MTPDQIPVEIAVPLIIGVWMLWGIVLIAGDR